MTDVPFFIYLEYLQAEKIMVKVEIVCMAAELIYHLNALTSFITFY